MKKIFSIILVLIIMVLSVQTDMLYIGVNAAEETPIIWNGLESARGEGVFLQGNGTKDNPYIIQNGDQLYRMVYDFGTLEAKLSGGTPAYYKLACDIYLNDISNYDSWGKVGFDMSKLNNWVEYQDNFCHRTFYGNFDGDGHTIYGLYAYGYRTASFVPNMGLGSVIRNVNFKNSYVVNTSNVVAEDLEDSGETLGEKVWYAGVYGSAGVIVSRCDGNDGDYTTEDVTIKNCSVQGAYVEATYFTAAIVAAANSCQPYIADCMVSNVTLNSTNATKGVEGAIINLPYGSTSPSVTIENILAVGLPVYGVGADYMWSGKKQPTISHTYTFKNVYSTVSNKFTFKHSNYGNLSFTDNEITVVDASKLIGAEAEKNLPGLDWAYTWRAVSGGYPMPMREYIVPSGRDYYLNGGPKYTTDMWDGTVSEHFAAGDGSFDDPYLIANCEEFYRMATMPENDKYYKIANGVTDLYFNDIEGKSYSTLMAYFSWGIGTKYAYSENVCFNGDFDGNGVVFHGIYSSSSNYSALFAQVGNASLRNLTISYSYFKTTSSAATGVAAVVGNVKANSRVDLKNIAVIDCTVTGKNSAAGFVGNAANGSEVYITDCVVSASVSSSGGSAYKAGFLSNGTNCSATVKNSISVGNYPASTAAVSYNSNYSGVYTDTSAPSTTVSDATQNINVVAKNALIGEAAKTTCKEFNWTYSWRVTDDIPLPLNQQNSNGIVGEYWSGQIAMSYAGGTGTKGSPYQINTPEMLARMLVYGQAGEYYQLTADININDTTKENWQQNALEWYTSSDVSAFEASFNGNGYTVYGLYSNADEPDEYAALIPVLGTESQLKRVKLDNSYLEGISGAYLGGIAGILQDNSAVATNINACVVGDNVLFYGEANVGGIISEVGFARAIIENSVFKGTINTTGVSYGIGGSVFGKMQVNECISLNVVPFASSDKITAKNIYTNVPTTEQGVIVLEYEKMVGVSARNYMTALDYTSVWRLSTTDLPSPTGNTRTYNGVKGEVWSGKIAAGFAKGTGAKTNPYIIETGEQLALLVTKANNYADKHFKLAADIYLNDVNGELWQSKSGSLNWLTSHDAGYFKGHLDGDGYVVFGMYHNTKSTPSNTYIGLIPLFSGSATIKNIGISQAYIKATKNDSSVYAGGIFGMGNAFYDFYGKSVGVNSTVGDEFLIPGQTIPTKLPSITNCFVDHKSYIEATSVGGIGCAGGAAIVIRDCYVTATLVGAESTKEGSLLGPNWAKCSRVYNSFAFTQSDNISIGGSQQWVDTQASICTYTENVYYYGNKPIFGTIRIKRPQWRLGDEAKDNMSSLDWENTWRTEPDGTPVLCVFDKEGRSAALFSDKEFAIPEVTYSFDTGVDGFEIEPLTGKIYEKIELPTPKRQGYKFVAWHSFEDLSCEYEYDFFLARDITLYAEWKDLTITQDFENYPCSIWDYDSNVWRFNTPDNQFEYNADYVHDGKKSIQLMDSKDEVASLLINYKKTLTAGQQYTISFWTAATNPSIQPQLALSHKTFPDYLSEDKYIEPITNKAETVGKWTRYEHTFVSQTPWVEIKVLNGDSLYVDDVVITMVGDALLQTEMSDDVCEGEYYGNTLEGIVINNGATKIDEFGFAYSDLISDVFIADTVTEIGQYAFYGCDSIIDVWYSGSEEDFKGINILENNDALKEANWHFNCCTIRQPQHTFENGFICSVCGQQKTDGIVGDANGDGKLNTRDCAIIMQYINGWDVVVDIYASDVNGDGSVNMRDYAMLIQYLNGWDIKFRS